MLTVSVDFEGTTAVATVLNDGQPITAEVQWLTGTPFRPAPGGVARLPYFDADELGLADWRYNPPTQYQVTARAAGIPEPSPTVLVDIPAGAVPTPTPAVVDGGLTGVFVVDRRAGYRTIPAAMAAIESIAGWDTYGIQVSPGTYDGDFTVPPGVVLYPAAPGTVVINGDIEVAGGARLADGIQVVGAITGAGAESIWSPRHGHPSDVIHRYPHLGAHQTTYSDSPVNYILYKGAGSSGVIRCIWFATLLKKADWSNHQLWIYYDRGDIVDPAAMLDEPDVRLDLRTMSGWGYLDDIPDPGAEPSGNPLPWNTSRSNRVCDWAIPGMGFSFALNIPVPYSNGVLIALRAKSGDNWVNVQVPYSWASYDEGPIPTFWQYARWRLKSTWAQDTLAGPYVYDPPTLLDAAGPGMLVGLWVTLDDVSAERLSDFGVLENNFRFCVDSENVNWEVSGAEDIFGMLPYYMQSGPAAQPDYGCLFRKLVLFDSINIGAYRLFLRDPFIWSNSCSGVWPPSGTSIANDWEFNSQVLYYSPS